MRDCKEYEGLMAQSLYETLHEYDAERMDSHLLECESCAREHAALTKMLEVIPSGAVSMDANLRPALEEQIRSTSGSKFLGRRFGLLSMAALLLVAVPIGYIQFSGSNPPVSNNTTEIAAVSSPFPVEYQQLIEQGEFAKAFVWLDEAMVSNPKRYESSENRLALARLAFDELQWYPEAYEAYSAARTTFPEAFRNSGEDIRRYALLDEAHANSSDFAMLHDWNRVQNDDRQESYGEYIQNYPGTLYASDAVGQMARIIAEETLATTDDGSSYADAMELALAQEENPIIVAQLKLELGRFYGTEANDPDKARTLLKEVESGPITVLAKAAEQTLSTLDAK